MYGDMGVSAWRNHIFGGYYYVLYLVMPFFMLRKKNLFVTLFQVVILLGMIAPIMVKIAGAGSNMAKAEVRIAEESIRRQSATIDDHRRLQTIYRPSAT